MTPTQIKTMVKQYANLLQDSKPNLWRVYLFGSYVKNKARVDSDIDVAVVINGSDEGDNKINGLK